MTRVDLRAALDMLPRLNFGKGNKRDRYCTDGTFVACNYNTLPKNIDKLLHRIIEQVDDSNFVPIVEQVDVTCENIWVIHRCLRARTLKYLYRLSWAWQKWKFSKLPVYIRYHGKLVIWNGTHRCTLGRLAQRKVRARVIDIDKFIAYKKKNPKTWQAVQVITVKPKKKGKHK